MFRAVLTALVLLCHQVETFDAWINEFHHRNYQQDVNVFVEVVGPAGEEAWRYQIIMYQGRDGAQFSEAIGLSGHYFSKDSQGDSDFGFLTIELPSRHHMRHGKYGGDGLALVRDSQCSQFISYGDHNEVFVATTGPCTGIQSTSIGVQEPFDLEPGFSLQLHGAGRYRQNFTWWWTPMVATPGAVNKGQTLQSIAEYFAVSSVFGVGLLILDAPGATIDMKQKGIVCCLPPFVCLCTMNMAWTISLSFCAIVTLFIPSGAFVNAQLFFTTLPVDMKRILLVEMTTTKTRKERTRALWPVAANPRRRRTRHVPRTRIYDLKEC